MLSAEVGETIGRTADDASAKRARRSSEYHAQQAALAASREIAWLLIKFRMDRGHSQQELDDLALIAWLHLAGHRYTRYTQVAHRLGSNHWQSIEALAESALAAGRHDVAVDVFRAADQPGMHRDHLRRRCLALTGVQLDDGAPRLRVVDDTA